MDNKVQFTKLKDLVDDSFTVEKVHGYKWKMWDNESKRMISEDEWFKGARKIYAVDTDKGRLDMSESQLASIFVGVQHGGVADINGVTVNVKSNGKAGMDIRYFLNPTKTNSQPRPAAKPNQDAVYEPRDNEEISLDDIPF